MAVVEHILTYTYVVFLVFAAVGMMLLWSDTFVDGIGDVSIFFNLLASAALYTLSATASDFVPSKFTSGVRMVALYLLFTFADSSICRTDYYLHLDGPQFSDLNQRNTVRVGSIMLLVCIFGIFLVNHCIPTQTPFIPRGLIGMRHIVALVTACAAMAAQIIIYNIDDMCNVALPHRFTVVVKPAIFAIVTLTSHLFNDRPMQDFTLMIAIYWLIAAAPIFDNEQHPTQSNYPELWRASVGLLYAGCALYVLAALVHGVMTRKKSSPVAKKKSFKTLAVIVQVLFLAVAIGGAVTVFAKSHQVPNTWNRALLIYLVCGSLLIPLFNVLRELMDLEALYIIWFALSFHLLGALFSYLHLPTEVGLTYGWVRGGIVWEVCAVIGSLFWVPFVRAKERSAGVLFEYGAVFAGVLFVIWGLATCYTWGAVTLVPLGAQVAYRVWPIALIIWFTQILARGRQNEERVMFFIALQIGCSGFVWLINDVQHREFDFSLLFVGCALLVFHYLITGAGTDPFPFIHHLERVKPVTPHGVHGAPEARETEPYAAQPEHPDPHAGPVRPHEVQEGLASGEHHA